MNSLRHLSIRAGKLQSWRVQGNSEELDEVGRGWGSARSAAPHGASASGDPQTLKGTKNIPRDPALTWSCARTPRMKARALVLPAGSQCCSCSFQCQHPMFLFASKSCPATGRKKPSNCRAAEALGSVSCIILKFTSLRVHAGAPQGSALSSPEVQEPTTLEFASAWESELGCSSL